jgi:hypothetical protein
VAAVALSLLVLALNIITGFTPGETILGATWKGRSALRAMDCLMFALFSYACAVHRPRARLCLGYYEAFANG